jgi:hypothetical protein|eukprot:3873716-Prymnesium_polylepis.3
MCASFGAQGWFLIDLASVMPVAFDILPVISDDFSDLDSLLLFRVVRVLRLIKLVRLLRAARLLKRWETQLSINYGRMQLLGCLGAVIFAAHWFACFFSLSTTFVDSKLDTWMECEHGRMLLSLLSSLSPLSVLPCRSNQHARG